MCYMILNLLSRRVVPAQHVTLLYRESKTIKDIDDAVPPFDLAPI